MTCPWLILDANYLCHRVRWSLGDLSWKGSATAVLYGFFQTVLRLEQRFGSDRTVFCFDSRNSKRRKLYSQYKANRKKSDSMTEKEQQAERDFRIQIIKLRTKYLPAIGYRNIFFQPGYEADDLIAVTCMAIEAAPECQWEAVVITADHDLYQCIRGNISILNLQSAEHITLQKFYKTYGIKPGSWAAVKSIAGCTSDNIPGAKGIGEKTALKFIQGTLSRDSKAYQIIQNYCLHDKSAQVNIALVALPFEGTKTVRLRRNQVTKDRWLRVCSQLGIKSLKLNTRA